MSEKKIGRKSKVFLSIAEVKHSDATPSAKPSASWWSGLPRNSKLMVLGIIAFLSVASLGAGLKYLDDDAKSQKKLAAADRSLLSSVNPFLALPSPTPTPQLSKEYVYAGSRLLTVEDANANAAPPTDLAVWRPTTGQWFVRGGPGSSQVTQVWGDPTDEPAPGDYDGDGKTDFCIFRRSAGPIDNEKWYIIYSSTGEFVNYVLGTIGDVPAHADYDGDGKTDSAVYRPSTGVWYIKGSLLGDYTKTWGGVSGDVIASADYDGDGKADIGIWRPSDSTFYSIDSSDNDQQTIAMSQSGEPVSGDYDGDGRADYAIFTASSGNWYVRQSTTTSITTLTGWGQSGDRPVQNDYDGDGKIDHTVWRPSDGKWYIRNSQDLSYRYVQWGQNGDTPVPALYRR